MSELLIKDEDGVCYIKTPKDLDRIMIRRNNSICYTSETQLKPDISFKVNVEDQDVLVFMYHQNNIQEYNVVALETSEEGDFELQKIA